MGPVGDFLETKQQTGANIPIGSMYTVFTYIYP